MGWGSAPRPGRLYSRERPGIYCTGGWVGPMAGLDGRKILSQPGFDPRTDQPVAPALYRLSYPAHWNIKCQNAKGRLQTSCCFTYFLFLMEMCSVQKILSTPSFGGEVKPSVPCRRFAACKRSLNLRGSRNLGKITGQFLAHSSTFRC